MMSEITRFQTRPHGVEFFMSTAEAVLGWMQYADALESEIQIITERRYSRRNGVVTACGCWYYAHPGIVSGNTRAVCPKHGETVIDRCNIQEPKPNTEWVHV